MSDPTILDPAYLAILGRQTDLLQQTVVNGKATSDAIVANAATMASIAASQKDVSTALQSYDAGIIASRRREELATIAIAVMGERMTATNHPDMATVVADAVALQAALDRASGGPSPAPAPAPAAGGGSAVIVLDDRSIRVTLQAA